MSNSPRNLQWFHMLPRSQALHHTNPFSFLPQAFRKFKSDSMDSASAWHHCIQECHAMSRLHLDGIQHHPQPDTQGVTVQRIVFSSTVSAARCTVSSFFSDDQIWFCQEDLGQPVAPAWPHRGTLRNFACFFSSIKLVLDMAVCQNLVPLVNIKIAGKWMFIPLKMVLIGIDPYPYV